MSKLIISEDLRTLMPICGPAVFIAEAYLRGFKESLKTEHWQSNLQEDPLGNNSQGLR
jgi:hypothetical protein